MKETRFLTVMNVVLSASWEKLNEKEKVNSLSEILVFLRLLVFTYC